MNLYRVECKGMVSGIGSHTAHGIAYVVAPDPTAAYEKLRQRLDEEGLGFAFERELDKVVLIAGEGVHPEAGMQLIL